MASVVYARYSLSSISCISINVCNFEIVCQLENDSQKLITPRMPQIYRFLCTCLRWFIKCDEINSLVTLCGYQPFLVLEMLSEKGEAEKSGPIVVVVVWVLLLCYDQAWDDNRFQVKLLFQSATILTVLKKKNHTNTVADHLCKVS